MTGIGVRMMGTEFEGKEGEEKRRWGGEGGGVGGGGEGGGEAGGWIELVRKWGEVVR